MNEALLIVIGIIIVIFIVIYNKLVTLKNNRKQAFSDIDVQLRLRYDLIPNLVATVQGYATHEKTVFEEVAKARSNAMNAGSINEKIGAENQLTGALKSLFAVAENYPDLKANKNFLDLQYQLSDVENKIAASRRFFNNATKELNSYGLAFPNIIIAKVFGFKEEPFFELGEQKEEISKNVNISM